MKDKLKQLKQRFINWTKTHKILLIRIGIGLGVVLASTLIVIWTKGGSEQVSRTDPVSDNTEAEPEIVVVPSPLTGLSVEEELAQRPVTAFIIENSPEARPQSSLHDAGVVFESIAEGGITRFVAFYQETRPEVIGPIRSLRPYFIDMILAFDASIGHVGGSTQALSEARSVGVKSLDQFANGPSYVRTTDRFAPHNVYTDFDKIDALNETLGYTSSDFKSWDRKDEDPLTTAKASQISVPISSYLFNPVFDYKTNTNNYVRSQAGETHTDRETGKLLKPKVVIVIRASSTVAADGRYSYDLIGSGKATIFQDGDSIAATWRKNSRSGMMNFEDANGDDIALNKGQVWISVISPGKSPDTTP